MHLPRAAGVFLGASPSVAFAALGTGCFKALAPASPEPLVPEDVRPYVTPSLLSEIGPAGQFVFPAPLFFQAFEYIVISPSRAIN